MTIFLNIIGIIFNGVSNFFPQTTPKHPEPKLSKIRWCRIQLKVKEQCKMNKHLYKVTKRNKNKAIEKAQCWERVAQVQVLGRVCASH